MSKLLDHRQPRSLSWIFLATLVLWIGYASVVGVLFVSSKRTVTEAYRLGGDRWTASEPLYDGTGTGFIYLPQSAALFSSWSRLPFGVGEHAWRWSSLAIFFVGFVSLARLRSSSHWPWVVAWGSWCILPVIFDSVRNGQATIALTGMLLLATTALARGKVWYSSAYLWLAMAIKPLALVPMALSFISYRRAIVPLILGGVLFVLVPFLLKDGRYALSQTLSGLETLRDVDRRSGEVQEWSQFFSMFSTLVGVRLSALGVKAIQLSAGILTLLACVLVSRILPARGQGLYLFAFGTLYLALFNGRTESNTYAMISPILGILAGEAVLARRFFDLSIVVTCTVAITGNFEFGRWLTLEHPGTWLAPLGACVLTGLVLAVLKREATFNDHGGESVITFDMKTRRAA